MFTPRLTRPQTGNKYYIREPKGYNKACLGSPKDSKCDVLANCVGYANGRFNEIIGSMQYQFISNAETFYAKAKAYGLKVGKEPKLGGIMVWQKGSTLSGSDGAGHVAIVEIIYPDNRILTSESGYNANKPWWTQIRTNANGRWGQTSAYTYLGCIYNPNVKDTDKVCPYKKPTKTVLKGQKNDNVKWVQWYLRQYGFTIAVDGSFGNNTYNTVRNFQSLKGLEIDGKVGPKTRAKLAEMPNVYQI